MRPIFKLILILIPALIIPALSTSGGGNNIEKSRYSVEGKELKAMVVIKGGMYLNHGHPVGFHFDLLNRFANHQRCKVKIKPVIESDPWRELTEGRIDLLVVDSVRDTIPDQYSHLVISGLDLNDYEQVWVVAKENYTMLQNMNYWIGYYRNSEEYSNLIRKYYKQYKRVSFENGPISVLSPYDPIIKRYASTIGWDWRLLASLIYQESKFSMSARSGRGAHGLMQVMSQSAKHLDISELYDPELNIKAGTMLIKRLSNLYKSSNIDSVNQIKFVLAAYNAGEGRVEDIRRFAIHTGINHNEWDSAKSVISMMRERENLPEGVVKLGTFKGTETLNFVDSILERYDNYKVLVK
ncbi:MAG: transglycosylase SLT domain-containing protein [Bacteroidales bacterium]|jgi:membrane-bound lytic murein transglycosylase F|nr:transglycosylase SLT domain-containing protein [Bacteroidales bacterium]